MKGTISMQIAVRYFWQGAASQQDLSAKGIELTETELATIYGGADQPVGQQAPTPSVLGLELFGQLIPIIGPYPQK
jgi:bacteriocin-like protein